MERKGNILLFMPTFFWYFASIPAAFEEKGYKTFRYSDRPSNSVLVKSLIRINRHLAHALTKTYLKKITKQLRDVNFNYVIVIEGQSFLVQDVLFLRKRFSKAHFVFLLWDDIENFKYSKKLLPYFDDCFSFSRKDTKKYQQFQFLPDFFNDHYERTQASVPLKYDFLYIGTGHPKKHKDIQKIVNQLASKGFTGFVFEYLPSRFYYLFCKIKRQFQGDKMSDFKYKKMAPKEVDEHFQESKFILDSQTNNAGLTMRTFDCLFYKKKMITTNPDVKNYDFYRKENIYIAENGEINFSDSFFSSDYIPVDPDIVQSYSLSAWCDTLLGKRKSKN